MNEKKCPQYCFETISPNYEKIRTDFLSILKKLEKEVLIGEKTALQEDERETINNIRHLLDSNSFQIAVMAGVSSGKSTLLNALLGRELLPARNEATTAKLIYIKSDSSLPKTRTDAVYRERSTGKLTQITDIDKYTLNEWNDKEDIIEVELKTFIPWFQSDLASLELIDTPSFHNTFDQEHKIKTYSAINNSETAPDLILYIIDYNKMEVEDDRDLLDKISKTIKEGGWQANDRFLFVVNRIDELEGITARQVIQENVRKYLQKNFQIEHPHIFPLSALAALLEQMRMNAQRMTREQYNKYLLFQDTLQEFDEILDAALCPPELVESVRKKVKKQGLEDSLITRSGLLLLQEAILQYHLKYSISLRLNRFYQESKQKLIQDEQMNHYIEQEVFSVEEERISLLISEIERLKRIIDNSQIASIIDAKLKKIQQEMQYHPFEQLGWFEYAIFSFMNEHPVLSINGKILKEEVDRSIGKLQQKAANIAAKVESEIKQKIDSIVKEVRENIVQEFESLLEALLKQSEFSNIKLPTHRQLAGNLRLSLDVITKQLKEQSFMQKTRMREIEKEKSHFDLLRWFQENYSTSANFTIEKFDLERLRMRIQREVTIQSRNLRKQALKFLDEQMEFLRKSIAELIKQIEWRIKGKLDEMQRELQDMEQHKGEKRKRFEQRIQLFKSLLEELERLASLGLPL